MVSIENRVRRVLERVAYTCERVGRSPSDVKLVAVSKTFLRKLSVRQFPLVFAL